MSKIAILSLMILTGCAGCPENCSGGYGPRCPTGTVEMLNKAGTAFVCVKKKVSQQNPWAKTSDLISQRGW